MTLPALGLDVSKIKFAACLSRGGGKFRHRLFPNSPSGFSQLSALRGVEAAKSRRFDDAHVNQRHAKLHQRPEKAKHS
jgi:hypothetical protein